MLHEIAITPDVFLSQGYDPPQLCEACTEGLHQAVLEWCVVRDLRGGDWKRYLRERMSEMPFRTRAFWKSLLKAGRLRSFGAALPLNPSDDLEWCAEAMSVHTAAPCLGILASATTKRTFQHEPVVASVETRTSSDWWKELERGHPDGPTTLRRLSDYRARISPLLSAANGLSFVDPHLDPTRPGYGTFLHMIREALQRPAPKPRIEVHRCCYEGSGQQRRLVDAEEWERRFRRSWESTVLASGSSIEVFVWSDLHDRYLLSELLGIHLGNGFDTTDDVNKRLTWTRLSAGDRDKIQRDLHPQVRPEALRHRFIIR